MLPLLTAETEELLERSHIAFWSEKLRALQSLPENPYGAQIRQFGQTTALLASGTCNDSEFNCVAHMNTTDLPLLPDILSWYRSLSICCRFDITPTTGQEVLFRRLATQGFYQSGFHGVFYGLLPQSPVAFSSRLVVKMVSVEERDHFANLYSTGFEYPVNADLTYLHESIRLLPGRPGIHCFIVSVDDVPAGMAVLSICERIGYLGTAAVLPAFRDQGCHKALLFARMTVARIEGCHLIVGSAGIGSIGQHNMEKAGLRLAYTKSLWTEY